MNDIGIRTEVEKVELEFDSRPKQIGYIDFELYSPTGIVKLHKDDLEDYFRKEMYKKENFSKRWKK